MFELGSIIVVQNGAKIYMTVAQIMEKFTKTTFFLHYFDSLAEANHQRARSGDYE
jgi:hypothetical protein